MLDVRYEPVRRETMPESQALQGILPDSSETSAVHGHGSIAALRGLVERLAVGGFILVNDFAHRPAGTGWEASNLYPTYGGAVAMGQNFPQIDREVARWPGAHVHRPPDSEAGSFHGSSAANSPRPRSPAIGSAPTLSTGAPLARPASERATPQPTGSGM